MKSLLGKPVYQGEESDSPLIVAHTATLTNSFKKMSIFINKKLNIIPFAELETPIQC